MNQNKITPAAQPAPPRAGLPVRHGQGPIAPLPELANAQHYEVPAAFFDQVLGPRRKYSCCYWPPGVTDLAARRPPPWP
jgi:hypothetical protein